MPCMFDWSILIMMGRAHVRTTPTGTRTHFAYTYTGSEIMRSKSHTQMCRIYSYVVHRSFHMHRRWLFARWTNHVHRMDVFEYVFSCSYVFVFVHTAERTNIFRTHVCTSLNERLRCVRLLAYINHRNVCRIDLNPNNTLHCWNIVAVTYWWESSFGSSECD